MDNHEQGNYRPVGDVFTALSVAVASKEPVRHETYLEVAKNLAAAINMYLFNDMISPEQADSLFDSVGTRFPQYQEQLIEWRIQTSGQLQIENA